MTFTEYVEDIVTRVLCGNRVEVTANKEGTEWWVEFEMFRDPNKEHTSTSDSDIYVRIYDETGYRRLALEIHNRFRTTVEIIRHYFIHDERITDILSVDSISKEER